MSFPGFIALLSWHNDTVNDTVNDTINLTRKRYDTIINSSLSELNDDSNDIVIDEHFKRIFPSMSMSSLKKLTQLQMKLDDANINIDIRNKLKNESQRNMYRDVTSFTHEYTIDMIKLTFSMPTGVYTLTISGVKGLNNL